MTRTQLLACFITLALASIAGCGGPAHTETTSTQSQEHTEGGDDVTRTSTDTTQTQSDGSQTVDYTETTQTTTPASGSTTP